MYTIRHASGSFTIIDCCLPEDVKNAIVAGIKADREGKDITRFISTHPDEDHLLGLKHLDEEIGLRNFYCIKNKVTKEDETDDFKHYCTLRDSKKAFYMARGVTRKWMNWADEERGSAGIRILWPIVDNEDFKTAEEGGSPNNVSAVLTYRTGGATFMWMGDIETDLMEKIVDEFSWPKVDILFAPHHGRSSGRVPHVLLDQLKPRIIVIGEAPSRHLHYYGDYEKLTQNSAGDITFECETDKVHIFASENTYEISHLDDEGMTGPGKYLGTLNVG